MGGMLPYYPIGQWHLPTRRLLRVFVAGTDGSVYFARVPFEPVELTREEAACCDTQVFPELLRRLEEFNSRHPGILQAPRLLSHLLESLQQRPGRSLDGSAPASLRAHGTPVMATAGGVESPSGRLFGALLVEEKRITAQQLDEALWLQAASPTYRPLGHVLVSMRLMTRRQLTGLLERHRKRSRLGRILVNAGCITAEQLDVALAEQQRTGRRIGQTLVERGHVSEATIRDALCTQLHVNFFDLDRVRIDPALAGVLPKPFATRNLVVPVVRSEGVLVLAVDDPSNAALIEKLQIGLQCHIEIVTSTTEKLQKTLRRLYGRWSEPNADVDTAGPILVGEVRDPFVADLAARALLGRAGTP